MQDNSLEFEDDYDEDEHDYEEDEEEDDDENFFKDKYYYGYYEDGCHIEGSYFDDSEEYINLFNKKLRYTNHINFCHLERNGDFEIDNFIFDDYEYDHDNDISYIEKNSSPDFFSCYTNNDDALCQIKFIWYRADLVFSIIYEFHYLLLEVISNKLNLNINQNLPSYRVFNEKKNLGSNEYIMNMNDGNFYQRITNIYTKPLNYDRWKSVKI